MKSKINYRIKQEKILKTLDGDAPPRLLLHSCCAPCSSAVLEYLSEYFSITVLYFNPNIYPEEEFLHRIAEQKRLIAELPCKNPVSFEEHGWQQEVASNLPRETTHVASAQKRLWLRFLSAWEPRGIFRALETETI